jgi:hypothetical protein
VSIPNRAAQLLGELVCQLRGWHHLPDPTHLLAALAVAVTAADDTCEPAWLLLVAAPSSGKTEVVRLLDDLTDSRLDDVTVAGLLSWRTAGRGKPARPGGVLTKIKHGLLTLGDLSTLLAMSDRRGGGSDQVFAALRRVYDGHYEREGGVPGGGSSEGCLKWAGRLTVVGAVTGAIDGYSAHADQLGSRWLYARLPERDTAAKRSAAVLARRGGLTADRAKARALAARVVVAGRAELPKVELADAVLDAIEDAALVCCWGRAAVPRHSYGRREIDGPVTIEEPMRVIHQLGTVARGLVALGTTLEQTEVVCRRLALDSMLAARLAVLDVLGLGADNATTARVAAAAGLDRGVTRRALEDLEAVGVVHGEREGHEPPDGVADWRPCTWRLTGSDGALIAAVINTANCDRRCSENGVVPTQPPQNKDQREGMGGQSSPFSEHLPMIANPDTATATTDAVNGHLSPAEAAAVELLERELGARRIAAENWRLIATGYDN